MRIGAEDSGKVLWIGRVVGGLVYWQDVSEMLMAWMAGNALFGILDLFLIGMEEEGRGGWTDGWEGYDVYVDFWKEHQSESEVRKRDATLSVNLPIARVGKCWGSVKAHPIYMYDQIIK